MATLPARRKATRDTAEESTDSVNPVKKDVVDSTPTIETTTPCTENDEQPPIETAKLQTVTQDKVANLQEPLSIGHGAVPPVPRINPNESIEGVLEMLDDAIGETVDHPKTIPAQENCQSSTLNDAKVSAQDNGKRDSFGKV